MTARQRGRPGSRTGPPHTGREVSTAVTQTSDSDRKKVEIPTPEEWAREQLKKAPERSEQWAREVARIYLLTLDAE